jgi:hypothetical protein
MDARQCRSQLRIKFDTGVASSEFDSSCASVPLFIWNLIRPPQGLCTVFTTWILRLFLFFILFFIRFA